MKLLKTDKMILVTWVHWKPFFTYFNIFIQIFFIAMNFKEDEEAPFNFRSMLKKTNYQLERDNDERDYRRSPELAYNDENQNMFRSKLRPTGRIIDQDRRHYDFNSENNMMKSKTSWKERNQQYSQSGSGSGDSSRFVEEEIAPGVTVSGYEIDI